MIFHCNFTSMDKILWCCHSNETSLMELSRGVIYLVCSCNPMVLPFKWKIFDSIFTWYYSHVVCSSHFYVVGENPMVLPFKWNLFSSFAEHLHNLIVMYYFLGSNKKIFTNRSFVNFCHWHAVRRQVTFDVVINSPFVSQPNTRQSVMRISQINRSCSSLFFHSPYQFLL